MVDSLDTYMPAVLWETQELGCYLWQFPPEPYSQPAPPNSPQHPGGLQIAVCRRGGGKVRTSEFYTHDYMLDLLGYVLQRAKTLREQYAPGK